MSLYICMVYIYFEFRQRMVPTIICWCMRASIVNVVLHFFWAIAVNLFIRFYFMGVWYFSWDVQCVCDYLLVRLRSSNVNMFYMLWTVINLLVRYHFMCVWYFPWVVQFFLGHFAYFHRVSFMFIFLSSHFDSRILCAQLCPRAYRRPRASLIGHGPAQFRPRVK